MTAANVERMEFKTEVSQLLELVVHSLYSHKDIFLRELISNASDAIDKIRYRSLTSAELVEGDSDWHIRLIPDAAKGTLTIADNGVGMTHEELTNNLGTIAKSGTKEFLSQLQQNRENINLIGQFGVGFYSSFMVADRVDVISRAPQSPAFQWSSDGKQGYEITPAEKTTRGTEVVLHLKADCREYLEEWTLRDLVKKYSDFVEFPVVMDVERTETPRDAEGKPVEGAQPETKQVTETLNSQKAIWSKAKSEVKPEEYKEFYQHISHDYSDPLEVVHYHAEGTIEFKALIYIPGQAPFDFFMRDSHQGLSLYINRVFIMSDAKNLIPPYLRFIKGVVDTADLPLNVSREILQQNAQLEKIKKNIVNKVLTTLQEMKEKEYEKYLKFYQAFGAVLKEGLHYDPEQREAIAGLLLFQSSKTDGQALRSLDQYLQDMPAEQKSIYYLSAEDRNLALASPHLEAYRTKGYEVLFMLESVDEIVIPDVHTYKEKPLRAISQGELEWSEEEKKAHEAELQEAEKKYQGLFTYIQKKLGEEVKTVRVSQRLKESPACLVQDEHGMSKSMQEMWKAMGRPLPPQQFVLEINPGHPLIAGLNQQYEATPESVNLADHVALLYDQALLAAGHKIKDVAAFSRRLNQLLLNAGKN